MPTSNPVPSSSPLDLLFNAEKLDEAISSGDLTYTDRLGVQRNTVAGAMASAVATIAAINPRGAWVTATAYLPKDVVLQSSTWWVCVVAHTSSAAFATDQATKWRVYQGVTDFDLAADGGAALVGYLLDQAGAVSRTVEDKLNTMPWIDDLIPAGATDHTAYFNQAMANGGYWQVGAGPFTINPASFIGGTSGTKLFFHGTTINHATTTQPTFTWVGVSDWGMFGSLTIVGDGKASGTAIGVHRAGCDRFEVHNVVCKEISGWGFKEENGSSGGDRGDQGNWINCRAFDCWVGREDIADTGTEYTHWVNFTASGNNNGNITSAGNVRFSGGNIVDNDEGGVWVKDGGNHAHGGFFGVNINHNGPGSGGWNIRLTDVENGETFVGCHCYGDNAGTGVIWIEGSKGLLYTGGILDASIFTDGAIGYSFFSNNFCPDSVNSGGPTGDTPQMVIVKDNFTRAGMWKYNNPGTCYVLAGRSTTQSIPSATATTLICNNESKDTRNAYDSTTGIFTAPWQGVFKFYGSILINGASGIPATGGYCYLVVGGTPTAYAPIASYSSTLAIASFNFVANAALGTTVEIKVVLTGTTLVADTGTQLNIEEVS